MSYQGKKSIPHITVSAPAPLRPAEVLCGLGMVAARSRSTGVWLRRPRGFLRRHGWGGAGLGKAAPSPQPLGTIRGEPHMAGRGWSLGSLSPRACSPLPLRDVPEDGVTGGCGAEQKREGRRVRAPSLGSAGWEVR